MKQSTPKHAGLSREAHIQFGRTLRNLTAGKNDSAERGMVINARECKQKGGWPGWEPIYKDELFKRMVDLDAGFFRKIAEAIEYVEGGSGDDKAQAAAVGKGWYCLLSKHGLFPTGNELFDFVREESKACANWTRDEPNFMRTMKFICKHYNFPLRPEKTGRKRKTRK